MPLRVMIASLYRKRASNESDKGVEELLGQTINVAVALKLIKAQEVSRLIVDSTVQEKATAHPTDLTLVCPHQIPGDEA